MNIFKKILVGLVGLIALLLIVALFTRKDMHIEREVVIHKPHHEVFEYIKHLKNQDHYSVWAQKDPKMKKEFRGTDGTVGFVSAWDSEEKHVGKGEQEIKAIKENERIDTELRFMKPFEAKDDAYMTTTAIDEHSTKVTWGFKGHMAWPMNLMLLCTGMENELGEDLHKGLENLKKVLEH